jgi:hypothetical protein
VNGGHHEQVSKAAGPGRPAEVDGVLFEPGPIEFVERWQSFGATWRVVSRTAGSVTLSLCRCDSGEEVQRLTSTNPELIEWLADRTSSEQ